MRSLNTIIFTVLFLCIAIPVFAQNADDLKALLFRLEKLRQNFRQEKIHLHLDKPYYAAGDTIYFKAYLADAEKNIPPTLSNIIHIDLIDDSNVVKQSIQLPAWDGVAWGSMELPVSMQEGSYRIRAYSNWMRNFGEAFFFDKTILIGDALNNITAAADFTADSSSQNKYQATVKYTFFKGAPVAAKNVDYAVILNSKEIAKGKAVTDSSGKIQIRFNPAHLPRGTTAQVITRLKAGNNKTVTRILKLQNAGEAALQFFPEGGQLVYGLHSKVGFKATGADGLGAAVSGDIFNSRGDKITGFKSGFAGMGSFDITPFTGNEYYASARFADGTEKKILLPKILEQGYVLFIDNTDEEKLKIQVSANLNTAGKDFILIAQSNQVVQYSAKSNLGVSGINGYIPKKKFSTGIVQFTLFDALSRPVAERLVFIDHHDQLQMSLATDKTIYKKREHTGITLQAKDVEDNPVTGSFSMAVTAEDKLPYNDIHEKTMLSDLLLTSDLHGYVEDPNYYFTDTSREKVKELDNLLLTQGWRRFTWNDLLDNKYPDPVYRPEKSLVISGRVTSRSQPAASARVTLISRKGAGFTMDTLTGKDGSFRFEDIDLYGDSIPCLIQAKDSAGNGNVKVEMDKIERQPVHINTDAPATGQNTWSSMLTYLDYNLQLREEIKKYGVKDDKAGTLKEVVVKSKILSKTEEAVAPSANLNGPGHADQILTYEDFKNCNNLGNCLQGKIRGVYFKRLFDNVSKTINLIPFSTLGFGAQMMLLLDGMEMKVSQGGASLDNIPAQNIQSIEVLRSGAYLSVYGTRASGGVLVITTKHGGIDYNASDSIPGQNLPGTIVSSLNVYHANREFYSPNYSNPAINITIPDLRSTVFWKPDIVTDEYGKATIQFYNADVAGSYRVVVEGISEAGKLVRQVYHYEVH